MPRHGERRDPLHGHGVPDRPWHHLLFGKDTEKYALLHAEDSFLFLAYGCIVDEFQHRMYQNPDLTPDERNAVWLELEHKYRPWIDFDNLPFYGRGAGWQRQLHIYECPFYYIDYCLSTMAALQFFLLSLQGPQGRLGALPEAGAPGRSGQLYGADGDRRAESPLRGRLHQGHRPADGPVDRRASGVRFLKIFLLSIIIKAVEIIMPSSVKRSNHYGM